MKILTPPSGSGRPEAGSSSAFSPRLLTLSEEVLSIARAQILVQRRFLSRAMHELTPLADASFPLASDGMHLIYDPRFVLLSWRDGPSQIVRATAHILMHHLFRHMFVHAGIDQRLWNLACDIAAESMIRDLNLRQLQELPDREAQEEIITKLEKQVGAITAEKLMRHFTHHPPAQAELERLEALFYVDDHTLWYQSPEEQQGNSAAEDNEGKSSEHQRHKEDSPPDPQKEQQENSDKENSDEPDPSEKSVDDAEASASPEGQQNEENSNAQDSSEDSADDAEASVSPEGKQGDESEDAAEGDTSSSSSSESSAADSHPHHQESSQAEASRAMAQARQLEARWREISEQTQMEMEAFAHQAGDTAGNLEQALRHLNRERYDYADFLRKFATVREVTRLSPDEFDYVYYTYGLQLYRDMPLIEPLEYREDFRIRDLVIAIDTSGSVQGELVQRFLQKTYNILKQEEAFDRVFHLHLIQCDAQIQEDVLIQSQEEFDHYLTNMTLHGFGGTDFRPVFTYVDRLRATGQLPHMKGLLYFTDGFGAYPSEPTDYQTAFVFLDSDKEGEHLVPPWAIKVVLEEEYLEAEPARS